MNRYYIEGVETRIYSKHTPKTDITNQGENVSFTQTHFYYEHKNQIYKFDAMMEKINEKYDFVDEIIDKIFKEAIDKALRAELKQRGLK